MEYKITKRRIKEGIYKKTWKYQKEEKLPFEPDEDHYSKFEEEKLYKSAKK